MSRRRSRPGVDDRKLWGGVSRIAHNYADRKQLISEVKVDTHTNDDISITGPDIGDAKLYTTVNERETVCKGTISDKGQNNNLKERKLDSPAY